MKKQIFILVALISSSLIYSQVGINTQTPKATMDIVGNPTDNTKVDGFIAPRLTGDELKAKDALYTTVQTGAIVYANESVSGVAAGKTINVTDVGYYYFDGILWQKFTPNPTEPWLNQANNTQATANTQNIYQTGKVSIGGRNATGTLTILNAAGTQNTNDLAMISNRPSGNPAWLYFFSNLGHGSYSSLSLTGDKALVFSTDGDPGAYSRNAFSIIPHSNAGGATPFGFKITEQGLSTINAPTPTETFDVNGTFRVRQLPANGATNAIFTKPDGNTSLPVTTDVAGLAKTQTFTATRTVVADKNGVLGYVIGLPTVTTTPLEKIEELYLQTIDQQKQIDEQKNQIENLLKITEKLQSEMSFLKKMND